jgi:hypothetical protein
MAAGIEMAFESAKISQSGPLRTWNMRRWMVGITRMLGGWFASERCTALAKTTIFYLLCALMVMTFVNAIEHVSEPRVSTHGTFWPHVLG